MCGHCQNKHIKKLVLCSQPTLRVLVPGNPTDVYWQLVTNGSVKVWSPQIWLVSTKELCYNLSWDWGTSIRRQFWTFRRCQFTSQKIDKEIHQGTSVLCRWLLSCLVLRVSVNWKGIWKWCLSFLKMHGLSCLLQAVLHDVLLSWSLRTWGVCWKAHANKAGGE